ncbi:hypothetical protein R4282_11635 [Rhodococcus oxybenzonivorans]|uniref:hypothetical protein n=1 Tax=Rhodococcus oxybenzonivorans TaxID=1990687 RepID=UPI002953AC20|nr:hypothetical protein [Rhodococcus oxybenzonivorans]MDV7353659.1 hypothetical protein [Rhodococcus oxybenzonivorans]
MYIHIEHGRVTVIEPDNFRALSVKVHPGTDPTVIKEALLGAGAGTLASDYAQIDIEWLRNRVLTQLSGSADAHESFEAMVEYADKSGWVDPSGTLVRAHLDSSSPADSQ